MDEFETLATTLRKELDPQTRIEEILVDRVILAAWRLEQLTSEEYEAIDDSQDLKPITRTALRVECSLETALALLESARRTRSPRWGHAKPSASNVNNASIEADHDDEGLGAADFANEWPILNQSSEDTSEDFENSSENENSVIPTRWQDRLVFDPNVSQTSPVVKGTWVTVNHITSLVVDGWNWSDILRTHPELTEDDIRTCLAYTVEQDDRGDY